MTLLQRARGAVLLETIVALTILATVACAGAWLASEAIGSVRRVHQAEARVRAGARFLTAVSLWPREDLDRHLGRTTQGPWRMYVDRARPRLYAVTLVDSLTAAVVLRAAVYRDDVP